MIRTLLLAASVALLGGCAQRGYDDGSCCSPNGPPPASGPAPTQSVVYRCPMDGATRATPGPCPTCGMALDDRYRVQQ